MSCRLSLGIGLLLACGLATFVSPAPAQAKRRKPLREVVYLDVGAALNYQAIDVPAKTVRLRSDGRWQRVTKAVKAGATTTIIESGKVDAVKTWVLFDGLWALAQRARKRRVRWAAGDGPAETVAFHGFGGRPLTVIGRGNRRRKKTAFGKLVRFLATPAFTVPPRAKATWRISSHAWTQAGEGANWRLMIDSNGLLETMGGGDIGSGHQMLHGERREIDAPVLATLHKKLHELLAGYQRPIGKWSQQRGQGGSCEIVGFGPRTISLDLRDAVAKRIAVLLAAVRRRKIWGNALPFPIARVGYAATRGERAVRGLVTISGHWREKSRKGKVRLRHLSQKKLVRFFAAVQRAVDARPPAVQPAAPKQAAQGVQSISLYSYIPRHTRTLLADAKQRWLRQRIARIIEQQLLGRHRRHRRRRHRRRHR